VERTGIEPVTSGLQTRQNRSRPFAPVRFSLLIGGFVFVTFATTEPERTSAADNADKDFRGFHVPKPPSVSLVVTSARYAPASWSSIACGTGARADRGVDTARRDDRGSTADVARSYRAALRG
jgi:hypothetical protein